jgi:hypothetical protein
VTNQTNKFPNKLALYIDISSMCKDNVNLVYSNDVWVKLLEGFEIFRLVVEATRLQCKWSQEHNMLGNIQPNCPFVFEFSRQ